MESITVGVLTISDKCANNQASDESGPNLVKMIKNGIVKNAVVVETSLVPDEETLIQEKLKEWSDRKKIHLILTTGGTGVAPRDVTPQSTLPLLDKVIPGIPQLIFKRSSEITPLAALSCGVSGVRGGSLIVNLPGSKKASTECLEAISSVIPHAIHLIRGVDIEVKEVHSALQNKRSKVIISDVSQRARESPFDCIPVPKAQTIILDRICPLKRIINMSSMDALGYVLAHDICARDNLPPWAVSLKDGYAVLSADGLHARKVVGSVVAGTVPSSDFNLIGGYCVRINTGATIPKGADAVVQVEDTLLLSSNPNGEEETISIKVSPIRGVNIRPKGSDFKSGELLLKAETHLGASSVGLLAAGGITHVEVFAKPTVALFSTGDELVEYDSILLPGQVRDTNRVSLINLLKEENFPALDFGIVKDNVDTLFNALHKGFQTADVVVTTGGMSMGERDYLKEVLVTDFNAEICFGRVIMKPGKPTAFGVITFEGKFKLWFGLPGNPASALVTAHLFLLPALKKISGWKNFLPPCLRGVVLEEDVEAEDRPHYCRAVLRYDKEVNKFYARPTGSQSSSRIGSCATANCLLELPRNLSFKEGSVVNALLIGRLLA